MQKVTQRTNPENKSEQLAKFGNQKSDSTPPKIGPRATATLPKNCNPPGPWQQPRQEQKLIDLETQKEPDRNVQNFGRKKVVGGSLVGKNFDSFAVGFQDKKQQPISKITSGKTPSNLTGLGKASLDLEKRLFQGTSDLEKQLAQDGTKFDETRNSSRYMERALQEKTLLPVTESVPEEIKDPIAHEVERRLFQERSRFEELQNASRDLEKRLHERILCADQQQRSRYDLDMEKARNMLQNNLNKKDKNVIEKLEKLPKATQTTNIPPPLSVIAQSPVPKPISVRQDSNVSSDSFSQTSSPSYTSKTMEAPLLPHKHANGKVPGV